jgi:hypothetical protein
MRRVGQHIDRILGAHSIPNLGEKDQPAEIENELFLEVLNMDESK